MTDEPRRYTPEQAMAERNRRITSLDPAVVQAAHDWFKKVDDAGLIDWPDNPIDYGWWNKRIGG